MEYAQEKKISLSELKEMKKRGELRNPEGDQTEYELPDEFWKECVESTNKRTTTNIFIDSSLLFVRFPHG